jgi:hypothetical protein
MKSTLRSRLKRLEDRTAAQRANLIRMGVLRKLPSDYAGERHIVVIHRNSNSTFEWCDCEERPGPAPAGSDVDLPLTYFSEDDLKL